MNTATLKAHSSDDSYGDQYKKLLNELTFVEDDYLNLHCLELDFNSAGDQQAFFNIHESELPINSQISCCISNMIFPAADFLVLTNTETHINYQLYITFIRHQWHSDIALENFTGILMSQLNQQNMTCKLEMTEEFGVYLSVNQSCASNRLIGKRVELMSKMLSNTQKVILR
ncbi:MAG: hypothetical protein HWE10_12015 [Gammaproteobacteria bacterium]|nr:hypothetical protein [Gammaproteobacteria bacterium]